MTQNNLHVVEESVFNLEQPELSDWKCYLFGNTPESNSGILWVPEIGKVPNFFVRWMMKICFGCTWAKEEAK